LPCANEVEAFITIAAITVDHETSQASPQRAAAWRRTPLGTLS
jgi:hypothetical protein